MNNDPFETPVDSTVPGSADNTSIGALIRHLTREVPELFTKELALAKTELQQSLTTLKAGLAAVAGAAVVLLAGLIILLLAVVYALAMIMQPWLAALIVGAVAMIVGFVMVQSGKKQLEPSQLAPERTMHSLHKDKDAIQRKVS